MTGARAAAVYARISSDDGQALGVTRQLGDCRRLAAELGWVIAEEYVDNDISAYSGKPRPAYQRMMEDLKEGRRDAVLAYHSDRIHRRPKELEEFVEVVEAAGVRRLRFVSGGDFDVTDGDALFVLRIQGAMAANESSSKSRRVRRKMDEVAAAGRPHGGSNRPFGFEDDRITHRPDEAAVVRTLVARFLAGESLQSLARWMDSEGIRTVKGGTWRTTSIRALLRSGRIAGLREHRGEVVATAVWDPIISLADRERVLARFAQRATTGRRTPQRYLLTGLARCGKCGNPLYSAARPSGPDKRTRRYVCSSGPDHGGCGKLTVVAEPLEELVAAAVLYRLDTPELADVMAGRAAADEATALLADSLAADKVQLDELAGLYAGKQIGAREWMTARNPIESRIRDTERRLAKATNTDALSGVAGQGDRLTAEWPDLDLSVRHSIVSAVVDHIVIGPGKSGARTLDPDRVDIVWRV